MPERWPRGLRESDAADYVGLSVTSVRALRAARDFPAPVQLTPGSLIYLREDVDAWLDRRAGRVSRPAEDGSEWLASISNEWDTL